MFTLGCLFANSMSSQTLISALSQINDNSFAKAICTSLEEFSTNLYDRTYAAQLNSGLKPKKKDSVYEGSILDLFKGKKKIQLTPNLDVDNLLDKMKYRYKNQEINDVDGVKIDFEKCWVHLRKSNTEPIIRVYTEAFSQNEADSLAKKIITEIQQEAQQL